MQQKVVARSWSLSRRSQEHIIINSNDNLNINWNVFLEGCNTRCIYPSSPLAHSIEISIAKRGTKSPPRVIQKDLMSYL